MSRKPGTGRSVTSSEPCLSGRHSGPTCRKIATYFACALGAASAPKARVATQASRRSTQMRAQERQRPRPGERGARRVIALAVIAIEAVIGRIDVDLDIRM